MVWEERWHPLREEWVMVAAHRQDRPWSGSTVEHAEATAPDYVPDCYLCPGNVRVSGKRNADYTGTFVFDNDLSSFKGISNNVWAKADSSGWADGGVFYVWQFWSDVRGYLSPSEWLQTGRVSSDVFEDVTLNSDYSISGSTLAAKAGKKYAGVFTDLNGKARPSNGAWSAGAVQI